METWHYPLLVVLGVVVGFLNVMAGGGSLLSMPALIFLGMDPALANGTNRIALLVQNATAITEFRRHGFADFKLSLGLAACTIPGAALGAYAAVRFDPLWFKRLLAGIMIAVLIDMMRPRSAVATGEGGTRPGLAHLAMVGVGFYGGFVQAGVGFILMPILRGLLRLDLVRVNMHKVFVVGVYMIPSLAVFAWQGQVQWLAGAMLAVGTALGAVLATRLQIARGEKIVRAVFAVAVVAMAVKLVWN
ncbi:MAG: sulfite exporter TauE/SafE family protein [Pseudomonadota bacterium]